MKKLFVLFVMLSVAAGVSAQQGSQEGSVVVHKDPRIDLLVKKQIEINEYTTRDSRRTAKGFRIQVINTRDRNEAINTKTRMLQLFPDHQSYIVFNQPFYKIKLGNFKTRTEAEQIMRQVVRHYPNGAFIIQDVIEVKPEKTEDF